MEEISADCEKEILCLIDTSCRNFPFGAGDRNCHSRSSLCRCTRTRSHISVCNRMWLNSTIHVARYVTAGLYLDLD